MKNHSGRIERWICPCVYSMLASSTNLAGNIWRHDCVFRLSSIHHTRTFMKMARSQNGGGE